MDSASPPVTDQEIAEVIDLIEELHGDAASVDQALALCRTVATLVSTPRLSLRGIWQLIEHGDAGDREQTVAALLKIASRHPDERWIQFRCGHHLAEIGLIQEGIDCYERSIGLKPTVRSHHHVAKLYRKLMQFEPCIAHLERALARDPENVSVRAELLFLVAMKGDLARFEELDIGADKLGVGHLANCYNRLGQTLVYQGDRLRGMALYDKAAAMRPDSFALQWSKQLTVPTIYRDDKDLKQARGRYLEGLGVMTALYDALPDRDKDQAYRCAEKLTNFEIHYQSENDIEVQQPYGALFHKMMSRAFPQFSKPLPKRHPDASRRIRVGFVSWGCFFTHSNYKTHGAWITDLDRARFEVFAYALAPNHDQTTTSLASTLEHFLPFAGHLGTLRQRIVDDQLDILVYPGIGMEPAVHRLAPLRLAPVQCTSWGHPVTSGLPNIDYFLSSALMEPEDGDSHYTETLIRLPNLGISQIAPGLPGRYRVPEMLDGRSRPAMVYLCSQNLLKMMPRHDYLFARILQAVPDSEIWFIESKRADLTATFVKRMATVCQSYGVDFNQRCLMLPRLGKAEFCYVNEHADAMLDTPFWSGCNTTFETLVHGTPVITLPGRIMRGRHTAAILALHGLDELICTSEQDYIQLAVRLAKDAGFRESIKERIEKVQPTLFGDRSVIEALEDFFEKSLRS